MRKTVFFVCAVLLFFTGGNIMASDKIKIYDASEDKIIEVQKVQKTDAEWKKILTDEQFRVTRLKATQQPFVGKCYIPPPGTGGVYRCICCGTDLFKVETKFESGTGWPSFWNPVSELNIRIQQDDTFRMHRLEVLCSRCDAHLGHVFDDGPPPTGKRYCINSVALVFAPIQKPKEVKLEKAAFAAGCFWGVQAAFSDVKGVVKATAGYAGGTLKNPTYEDVCAGKTHHAETVELEYDPSIISYEKLLDVFFDIHDPTTLNRQGPDIGNQYRSIIFYYSPQQKDEAYLAKKKFQESGKYKNPIVTEIIAAGEFYKAEEYHQDYYKRRGLKPACSLPRRGF